ncbi:MAG: Gfo/Idh/MocA family oxidoreductase [bacterium]
MKIIIFGIGSIGRRYAYILRHNFTRDIIAFRSKEQDHFTSNVRQTVHTWDQVKRCRPEVAFITNPTFMHIKTALKCASLNMHLYIEKPLSHNLNGVDKFAEVCRRKKLACYTAYAFRFHPVIQLIRKLLKRKTIYHARVICSSYLPRWRKDANYKKYYSVSSNKGGGVILDLSHELDYISFLFGQIRSINGTYGRASSITIDAEDYMDASIVTSNNVYVNLHLNYFSLCEERKIIVDFKNGYITGDLRKNRVEYCYNNVKKVFTFAVNRNDVLKKQITYFLDNLKKHSMMNNITESRRLIRKIQEFKHGR